MFEIPSRMCRATVPDGTVNVFLQFWVDGKDTAEELASVEKSLSELQVEKARRREVPQTKSMIIKSNFMTFAQWIRTEVKV